jgi:alkylation response protein AidB-like acyl-CoA dehydrogenase
MHFQWSEEQAALRAQYQEFGRKQVAPRAEMCYEHRMFDRDSWQALSDLGFWRIAVPTEYGGAGGTWWDFVAALEGLSTTSRDLGFLLSIIAHIGLIRSIMQFGTEQQRRTYLPVLMSGAVGSTAITEVSGGSDVARIKTQAVKTPQGYCLNGWKAHITNAPVADIMLVVARIPELGDRRDITLFLLERGMSGLETGEAEIMLGNPTSPTGDIMLNDLHVTEDAVLGGVGDGLNTIYNVINLDRVLYGIIAAGYLEPILHDALAYAQQREAFKQKIADHQYVQGRLTDMLIAMETARWISYGALDQLIHNVPSASMMGSVAKLVGAEALNQSTQNAMRLFGHLGYMDGPISRSVRDALGTLIAGGTTEMQRKNIFNQMVRLINHPLIEYPQPVQQGGMHVSLHARSDGGTCTHCSAGGHGCRVGQRAGSPSHAGIALARGDGMHQGAGWATE